MAKKHKDAPKKTDKPQPDPSTPARALPENPETVKPNQPEKGNDLGFRTDTNVPRKEVGVVAPNSGMPRNASEVGVVSPPNPSANDEYERKKAIAAGHIIEKNPNLNGHNETFKSPEMGE